MCIEKKIDPNRVDYTFEAHKLRHSRENALPTKTSVAHLYVALIFSKYMNTLDDSIQQKQTLARFKNKLKSWAGEQCTC